MFETQIIPSESSTSTPPSSSTSTPHPILQPMPFDISAYISEAQKKEIAEKVYTERLTLYVDEVLKSRSLGDANGITDMILAKTADAYILKLNKTFETQFFDACKAELANPESNFRSNIGFKLLDVSSKWIEKNTGTIEGLMVDNIKSSAKQLSTDQFTSKLTAKIDVNKLLQEALQQTFIDDAKKIEHLAAPIFNYGQKIDKEEACRRIIDILVDTWMPQPMFTHHTEEEKETVEKLKKQLFAILIPSTSEVDPPKDFVDEMIAKHIPPSAL